MIDPVELLEASLRIPSPSGKEADLAAFLVGAAAAWADEAYVDEAGNAVVRVGEGRRRLYFVGHLDTVPGEIEVRRERGWLHGRGAVDAKGPLCVGLAAAARLSAAARRESTVLVVGAVEEEAPGSRGARHLLASLPPPEAVIIGEPSGWEAVTLGYKGRLVLRALLERDNFHSAGQGSTAAEAGVEVWEAARRWAAASSAQDAGVFERIQATLQGIRSSDDGLRQRCELSIGFRLPLGWPPPRAGESLLQALPEGPEYRFEGAEAAYRAERDTKLARAFRVAIRQAGGRPRYKVKTGTSDMNVLAARWTVPMLAYGPGDSAFDHAPDERVEEAEVERSLAVLAAAFELLAGPQTPERS